MMQTSPTTDSDLLARYMQAGDEGAFTALVRTHERLVIGTATRITGNVEAARDVAQQVFATLARKAWLLTGRTSLVGWLHHAARHLALKAVRGERARQRRHEQVASENPSVPQSDIWPTLEEALAALPDKEREAVVMHHLQDCSYAEMAIALGLTEAAARKRVSRGLKTLGEQLRKRGFGGSVTALLAGATALQVGTPPLAVAGTLTAAAPFSLTLTTLMAHTSVKIAAGIILFAGIPIAWQSHANSALRSELAALQSLHGTATSETSVTQVNLADAGSSVERETLKERIANGLHGSSSPDSAEREALMARIATARQAQTEAQTRLARVQTTVKQLEEEVVISHGNVEELARSFMRKMLPMVEAMHEMEKLDASERETKEAELTTRMGVIQRELRPLMKAVMQLEDTPAEAARVNALMYAEALKLPDAESQRIERILLPDFEQLKRDGLISSMRPKENAGEWSARRDEAGKAMEKHVRELLPPEALKHPMFESMEGILMELSEDELNYLDDEHKATPQQ